MWIVSPPGVCLCPRWGWEPGRGSWSSQDGHPHPEEQSLAARAAWVSAPAVMNALCPWHQAWPPGIPLLPEVLTQAALWDSVRVPVPRCGRAPHAPLPGAGWEWCHVAPFPAAPEPGPGAASPGSCCSEATSGCFAPTALRLRSEERRRGLLERGPAWGW